MLLLTGNQRSQSFILPFFVVICWFLSCVFSLHRNSSWQIFTSFVENNHKSNNWPSAVGDYSNVLFFFLCRLQLMRKFTFTNYQDKVFSNASICFIRVLGWCLTIYLQISRSKAHRAILLFNAILGIVSLNAVNLLQVQIGCHVSELTDLKIDFYYFFQFEIWKSFICWCGIFVLIW